MRFGVLGPLEVWGTDGGPVRVPEARVRSLLGALLVREGSPVAADTLIGELWGEGGLPARPAKVLRSKLSQLRGVLDRAEPGGRGRLVHGPAGYRLHLDADDVDATRFRSLVQRARTAAGARERASLLGEALALWRGRALADFADAPFATPVAARLEVERLTAIEEQAEIRLGLGEHHLLADELGELTAAHPLRERLRGMHMRALYRAGRQAEALRTYEELRRGLAEDLGVDPGPDVARLHEAILRQEPQLAVSHEPEAALSQPRSNLPAPLTGLIGRERECAEVRNLLGTGRLVTLTGPGGVGKTRLALEAAAGLGDSFSEGRWLVELGALPAEPETVEGTAGPARVCEAIAAVIGLRDDVGPGAPQPGGTQPGVGAGGAGPAGRLARALRRARMLLVLDNCEHVVRPAAELVRELLPAAPQVRVLVTSRQRLGIVGEHVYEVPTLDTPGDTGVPEAGSEPAGAQRTPASVRLFAARASATAPHFRLDEHSAPAVAAICRRLDGLPLALELAAHRVRALGVHEVAARLDDRFALLATDSPGTPARQQTLRAVVDWSWDLLTAPERAVLRRMAVHAEGCTLEAAEAFASGGDPGDDVGDDGDESREGVDGGAAGRAGDAVLQPLSRLVDRSLLVAAEGPEGVRYRLLESVAAYAVERLAEAGETETVRRRHMHYFRDCAEQADPRLRGPDQQRLLRRLDLESANLRTALDTAVRLGDASSALRLALAPLWYRYLRGRLGEAHRSLGLALALDGGPEELRALAGAWQTALELMTREPRDAVGLARAALARFGPGEAEGRARVQWFLGTALLRFGELAASEELVGAALTEFRTRDDQWGVAAALCTRAWLEQARGRLSRFEADAAEGLELFIGTGDRWGQLQALPMLGHRAQIAGDYAEAARRNREGLRIAEQLGLWPEVSYRFSELGRIALLTGDHGVAERFHEQARSLAAEQGDRFGERLAELGLGLGARREGRLGDAEGHLGGWLERSGDAGPGQGPAAVALVFAELGFIAEQRGDAAEALRRHRRGMEAARVTGDPRAIALALEGLAGAHALTGRAAEAA
ncbi:hypothetical protein DB35_16530, partial [Streptomyces abyssalis]